MGCYLLTPFFIWDGNDAFCVGGEVGKIFDMSGSMSEKTGGVILDYDYAEKKKSDFLQTERIFMKKKIGVSAIESVFFEIEIKWNVGSENRSGGNGKNICYAEKHGGAIFDLRGKSKRFARKRSIFLCGKKQCISH